MRFCRSLVLLFGSIVKVVGKEDLLQIWKRTSCGESAWILRSIHYMEGQSQSPSSELLVSIGPGKSATMHGVVGT